MDRCLSMCVWWLWWLKAWPAWLSVPVSQHHIPPACCFPLILPPLHRLLALFLSFSYLLGFPIVFVVHPHLFFLFLLFFLSSPPSSLILSFLSLTTRCVVSVPPHDVKRMAWNSTGNNSEQSQSSGPAAPLGGSAAAAVNNIAKQSKNTARPLPSCRPTLKP